MAKFVLHIAKEYLKFSSAHFTIFDDTSLEKLHGHNYYVSLDIEFRDNETGITLDFKHPKKMMESLCDVLDEKTLLPANCQFLKIAKVHDQFEATFHGAAFSKTYSFPCEDVEILPVNNITSENLAKYFCGELRKKLESYWRQEYPGRDITESVTTVTVGVEETKGQSIFYQWEY